jgi:hypothetical protein
MKADKEQPREPNVPQLRVFSGEEPSQDNNRLPPDPTPEMLREWIRREAYWAGRNRAGRHSARLVA